MFGNLLGVTLGSTHILTVAYRGFWELLTRGLCNDLQIVVNTTGCIKLAHILCSVQLLCYSWFSHCRAHLAPPPPEFADILHQIMLQSYVLPHLPHPLFCLAYPMVTKTVQSGIQSRASVNSAVTLPMVTSSHSSNVSVVTNPTLFTRPTPMRGTFQANLTPDSTLQALVPGNVKLKDLIGADTPPLMGDTTPICLSFHLRQGCWTTCKRSPSHSKHLSPGEKQRLANFCFSPDGKTSGSPHLGVHCHHSTLMVWQRRRHTGCPPSLASIFIKLGINYKLNFNIVKLNPTPTSTLTFSLPSTLSNPWYHHPTHQVPLTNSSPSIFPRRTR